MEADLRIRPAEPSDAPLLAGLRNDPQTLLYLHDANQYSVAQTERWLAELPAHSRRLVVWQVAVEGAAGERSAGPSRQQASAAQPTAGAARREAASGPPETFVGVIRMDRIDWVNRNCMVGLDLVPAFRGRGYAQRVYAWLLDYLFAHLNMHMVYLEVLESNQRARRLYERLGFRVEGALREKVFRHGRYEHSILMSLLASEYAAARKESP